MGGVGLLGEHLHPLRQQLPSLLLLQPAVSDTGIESEIHRQVGRYNLFVRGQFIHRRKLFYVKEVDLTS